jgi:hypothetical protein
MIRRIHRQGEMAPHNLQAREERDLHVFQTEVVIDDPDHDLRPGMNADVTITTNAPRRFARRVELVAELARAAAEIKEIITTK